MKHSGDRSISEVEQVIKLILIHFYGAYNHYKIVEKPSINILAGIMINLKCQMKVLNRLSVWLILADEVAL